MSFTPANLIFSNIILIITSHDTHTSTAANIYRFLPALPALRFFSILRYPICSLSTTWFTHPITQPPICPLWELGPSLNPAMDESEYLQPGFDPSTLKVAELRGILLEHNVDYPSSAKKAQLVELFTQHVAPKARTILNARSRVKASGRGIVDAGHGGTPPVEATPRRRSSRRTTRMGTVDTEEDEEDQRSKATPAVHPQRRSASVKRASGKHTRATETDKSEIEDQEPPKSIRKTRKSIAPRQSVVPKVESPANLKYEETDEDEPVFSSHNPFQSGSSPAARSPDRADRRKVSYQLYCDSEALN